MAGRDESTPRLAPRELRQTRVLEKKSKFEQSQREAPVGLAVTIGNDVPRKQQLRGYFLATCPNYTSAGTTNQSGQINILSDLSKRDRRARFKFPLPRTCFSVKKAARGCLSKIRGIRFTPNY